jgi:putative tricarboxylic transport membrane protein
MIVFLSTIGSFAMRNRVEDILVTILFGYLGYLLNKKDYPAICIVLGLVLGDITEANFHRAYLIGRRSYGIFVSSSISIVLISITLLSITGPHLYRLFRKTKKKGKM